MEANVGGGKWRPIAEGLGRAEPTGSDLGIKQGRRHPLASPDEAGGVRSGFVSENVIGSELIKDLRLRLVEHR
jgi:hypothetical protein